MALKYGTVKNQVEIFFDLVAGQKRSRLGYRKKKFELDESIQIFCLWSLYLATIQMNDTSLKNWQLRRVSN